jgi:hypothetical protein
VVTPPEEHGGDGGEEEGDPEGKHNMETACVAPDGGPQGAVRWNLARLYEHQQWKITR